MRRQRSGQGKHLSVKKREAITGALFAMPAVIGTVLFFGIPFLWNLAKSFFRGSRFVFFRNYREVVTNSVFRMALGNTGKFLLTAVPLILVISLGIALLLYRKLKGHTFFRTVFVFPMVLPVASVILFFDILFTETGAMNAVLSALGIPVINWLNSGWAFGVLVLLYLWKNIGYDIVLFLAALNSVSREYYEAAELEGATKRQKLRWVTLPMIMPHLTFLTVISVTNGFKAFREAYILCGDYPHPSIYMLQHYINNNFQNLSYQKLSVAATLVFLLILALVLLLFGLRRRREGER